MPGMRDLPIPSPSLVVMIGAAGSGKSSFCRRNFRPDQIVSSDACRERISGDPADQRVTSAASALAHRLTEERLRLGRLTVFDATSVGRGARRPLLDMAERHHLPAVACVLHLPVRDCARHDRRRPDRRAGRAVILQQARELTRSLPGLRREGFAAVHRLRSPRAAASTRVSLVPLPCNRTRDPGPFDVIGDVHGCARELALLLKRLGYRRASPRAAFRHPAGRRAVFLGDLVDRGPGVVETVRIVMRMVAAGGACCVPGNHDASLLRCLEGGQVTRSPGLLRSLRQVGALSKRRRVRFVEDLRTFLGSLPAHLVFDRGRLAVAHAGVRADHLGRDSEAIRRFALLGETTGEVDRYGLPVRVKWAAAYRGKALIVYGHTPVAAPEWIGNTVNIDTGCVYGGKLTAFRYPERELVSVAAARPYYRPRRSLPARIGLRAETRALPSTV